MGKKNFQTGLDNLLAQSKATLSRPREIELPSDYIKSTYLYKVEQLQKIKAIAYYERITIGSIIESALEDFIVNYKNLTEAQRVFEQKK